MEREGGARGDEPKPKPHPKQVHFSEFSIASDKDSYDPWSRMRERAAEVRDRG